MITQSQSGQFKCTSLDHQFFRCKNTIGSAAVYMQVINTSSIISLAVKLRVLTLEILFSSRKVIIRGFGCINNRGRIWYGLYAGSGFPPGEAWPGKG
jgi:hypothetical protein